MLCCIIFCKDLWLQEMLWLHIHLAQAPSSLTNYYDLPQQQNQQGSTSSKQAT